MKLALLAAAGTGVQVGLAMVASEAVVMEVGAAKLGFLRYLVALILLLPFALSGQKKKIERKDILPIALIGIGLFGLLVAFLNLAVAQTSSARVSLIFATLPLLTIIIAWIKYGQAIRSKILISILLTILGVVVLVGGEAFTTGIQMSESLGLFYAFVATFFGALCSLLYRPYLQKYDVLKVSIIAMVASLVPLGIMALFEGGGTAYESWSAQTILLIIFIGVASGVGFYLWLYALKNAPADLVTGFLALSPLTAVLLSGFMLNAAITLPIIFALLLIGGGLVFMSLSARN